MFNDEFMNNMILAPESWGLKKKENQPINYDKNIIKQTENIKQVVSNQNNENNNNRIIISLTDCFAIIFFLVFSLFVGIAIVIVLAYLIDGSFDWSLLFD